MTTVREAVKTGAHALISVSDTPELDAIILLSIAAQWSKERVLASYPDEIEDHLETRYHDILQKRLDGVPIAYIAGHKEFYELDFSVDERVLIPRPDTEVLVDAALDWIELRKSARQNLPGAQPLRVLDVGTGSGCIAITIASRAPEAQVVACDTSSGALEVCRLNASRLLGHEIQVIESDLYERLPEKFDCIVSNPPYLTTHEWQSAYGERWFEPRWALDGGTDGLEVIRRLIAGSASALRPGGMLFIEASPPQMSAIEKLCVHEGLKDATIYTDLAGRERVLGAVNGAHD